MEWFGLFKLSEAEVAAISELNHVSDRASAILGAALLEQAIEGIIKTRILQDEKIQKDVFRSGGCLGEFGSKIKIGYLLGIYGEKWQRDMSTIQKIRNEFAHRVDVRDFSDQSIAQRCLNLRSVEGNIYEEGSTPATPTGVFEPTMAAKNSREKLTNPRGKYLLTIQYLFSNIRSATFHPDILLAGERRILHWTK